MSLDFCCTCHSLLFRGFLEICKVAVSISTDFLLHNYDLVLFYKQVHLRLEFFFGINYNTLEACTRDYQVLGFLFSYLYFISALHCNG